MLKAALKLRASLAGGLALVALLPQFVTQTWTLEYYSVKTVGNGIICQVYIESKGLSVSSVMGSTKPSIIANLCGITKLTIRLTLLG